MRAALAALLITFIVARASIVRADEIELALSDRHFNRTPEQLEQLAGGQDALVGKLLELRTHESPPFVGVRAEKILLGYASRADIQAALTEDLGSPNRAGLAQAITLNIDRVSDQTAKQALAAKAVARGKSDSAFAPYARALRESKDPAVSRLATQ